MTDPQQGAAAYRVLARKYRPRDFSALIGQEPMVRTLTNAFSAGRIAQAWMLTGVRGVGKTTTARILARALNYRTDVIDRPTIDLTVPGEHCDAIMEGRHVDVIEMDAASHTGIDDIREIIEQVRYRPVAARYKVYIIDEVHMLSTQAFNGLLKTLEEPPEHVKFIFATTEIRKVPITVLSRCQRFDLRRIDAGLLAEHLATIARLEHVETDDEALAMIARAGEGSARDCLSILDQAIAHGGGRVSAEAVRDMLGLADRARIIDLFERVMQGDVAGALDELQAQYAAGASPSVVLTDLADFTHLVTRLRFVPAAAQDASLTEQERVRGRDFAARLSVRALSRCWQMLLKGIGEVELAARPIAAAEMLLIRLAHAADLPTVDEALRRLSEGGNSSSQAPSRAGNGTPVALAAQDGARGASMAGDAVARQPAPTAPTGGGASMRLASPSSAPLAQAESSRPEPRLPAAAPASPEPSGPASLADLVALAEKHRDGLMKASIRRYLRLVRIEPGRLDVGLADGAPQSLLGDLSRRLPEWTGRRWIVSLSSAEAGPTIEEAESKAFDDRMADARRDPEVMAILAAFPGAKIIDVRVAGDAGGDDMPDDGLAEVAMPVDLDEADEL